MQEALLTRPEPKDDVLLFSDAIQYLEQKYHFNHRDYANSHSHFTDWCNQKGYGDKDPLGFCRGGSQLWYAEYKADADGECKRPPYEDFWHWLIEFPFNPVEPGETYELDLDYWLGEFAEGVAPLMQKKADARQLNVIAEMRKILSPALFEEFSQSIQESATTRVFPQFVKTILEYFKAEWGSKLEVNVGTW